MSQGKRLAEYIEKQGFTKKDFCNTFGFEYTNIASILTDKRPLGMKVINQIHEALPKLNIHWFLFGEGPEEINSDNFYSVNEPKEPYGTINLEFKIKFLEALDDIDIQNKLYEKLSKRKP